MFAKKLEEKIAAFLPAAETKAGKQESLTVNGATSDRHPQPNKTAD